MKVFILCVLLAVAVSAKKGGNKGDREDRDGGDKIGEKVGGSVILFKIKWI